MLLNEQVCTPRRVLQILSTLFQYPSKSLSLVVGVGEVEMVGVGDEDTVGVVEALGVVVAVGDEEVVGLEVTVGDTVLVGDVVGRMVAVPVIAPAIFVIRALL